MSQQRRSDVLGEPYMVETIQLPDDYEGAVIATLVHRATENPSGRAVLYVHGFADYFFQDTVAEFFTDRGYDFYALDLRKYGRSLLPHQTPNFCLDLMEYEPELDAAWDLITDRDGHHQVVVVAHSTGGLIAPLWAHRRHEQGLAGPSGFVLNSPWLDLQGSMLLRTVGTRAIEQVGLRRPYQPIPHTVTGVYTEGLHIEHRGEWDFNLAWKPLESYPVLAGWLRAIRRGHRALHRGLDTGAPVLVLTSSRSLFVHDWSPETMTADIVLDVKQIARWSHQLSPVVTIARVDDAIHDVYLSGETARECAYAFTDAWLTATQLQTD